MHLDHKAFLSDAIELKSADDGGDELANDIVTKALADLTNTVDARLKAVETKSADRMDKMEARLNRPTTDFVSTAGSADVELKAFNNFLRTGDAVELKALTTTTGTTGIIMPPQLQTTILERIAGRSPVRALASSVSMTGTMISIPRLVNSVTVGTVAETGPRPESEPSFEQIDLKSFEMSTFVPMSVMALEDANVDLGGFLSNHLVKVFGDQESVWFVNGNGTTQPEGVLTSTEVGVYDASDDTLVADDLIDLFYDIDTAYAADGAWMMNRGTMAKVRKMKDADGSYLWQPSIAVGQPATLIGRPVYEAKDMPNAIAGATPIIFGDFATAYLIADRINFEPIREDAPRTGLVYLGGRRRVGGRVVMGEALSKLKLAAA